MLMWATPSFTTYCAMGSVMPEEYSPITTGTLSTLTSLRAAFSAVVALPPESSTITLNFLPSTPPSALTFSTARATARRTSSPTVALAPVSDSTAPMLTVSWALAGSAEKPSTKAAAAAGTRRRERGIRTPGWGKENGTVRRRAISIPA
jgi:hypothetical protein